MDKNLEQLIRRLDNSNYKGVKTFVDELEKINSEERQDFVNSLYRNLSEHGIQKLDKVVDLYNKSHEDALSTHSQVMDRYNPAINGVVSLIDEYSNIFEHKNQMTDDFIREQFKEYFTNIEAHDIQDVVDEISRNIADEDKLNTFSIIAKQYGEEHSMRIRVSNMIQAEKEADEIAQKFQEDLKMADETSKDSVIHKFQYSILEKAQAAKDPDSLQATLNLLDKKLDFDGRKALDSAIRLHNKRFENENKFETRRVTISENAKDKSWQKLEADTLFSRKLHEFRERLNNIKKEKEKPHDKYDSGILNASMRAMINLQKLIKETLDFIRKSVEYKMNLNEKMEKRDTSPFYDVIKDAYKEKGKTIISALNDKEINKEDAEKIFIADMSYIASYGQIKKEELSKIYAESIAEALKDKNISAETKNTMLGILFKYENGEFDKQIKDNVKNGFEWGDSEFFNQGKHEEEAKNKNHGDELQKRAKKEKNKEDAAKAPQVLSERQQSIIRLGDCAKEAREIGISIAAKEFANADEAMEAFIHDISAFSYQHQELSKNDIELYTKIAAVSVMQNTDPIHKKFYKELSCNLSQFNDKDFKVTSSKSQICILLTAAAKIDLANSIKGAECQDNVFLKDIDATVQKALDSIEKKEQQQNFISGIADQIQSERIQYLLSVSSRKFGLKPQIHDNKRADYVIAKQIDSLADKYIKQSKRYNKNISTTRDFIALCDRIPESMGAGQKLYDDLQARLTENPDAMKILESDKDTYNQLNIEHGFGIVINRKELLKHSIMNENTENAIEMFREYATDGIVDALRDDFKDSPKMLKKLDETIKLTGNAEHNGKDGIIEIDSIPEEIKDMLCVPDYGEDEIEY